MLAAGDKQMDRQTDSDIAESLFSIMLVGLPFQCCDSL